MGTLLGNMEGVPLPGTLRERERYIKRDVKMLCKQLSLSIEAPLENLEGIRLPGLLRDKDRLYGFPS
jgi:hypothetical protein